MLGILCLSVACETKTRTVDSCGDGFLDSSEECDGNQMSVTTCAELGYYDQTETLTCLEDCTFNLAVCTGGRCGDGAIQTVHGEVCDGENLAGETCMGLSLGSGTLRCSDNCKWDTSGCELNGVCGDGILQTAQEEVCDGDALGDGTCVTEGFYEGELTCGQDCRYDTSGCSLFCGDGLLQADHGEACDGTDLAGQTCVTLGHGQASGALDCTASCTFDETACVPLSANADLSSLAISSGTLTPVFSAGTTSYSVTVPLSVTTVTVTATAADPYASLDISPSQPVTLNPGDNSVTVTVTSESGARKETNVTIHQIVTDYASPNIGTLLYVPGGTFQRDVTPANLSTVSTFRMSRYEITRAQWTAVTGWADPSDLATSGGDGDPVQMVNWYHAIAFCNKLSLLEGLTPVYSVSGVDFATLTLPAIPTTSNTTWNAAAANWSANGYRLPTEMEWMWASMGADTAQPGLTNTTGYAKAFAGSTGGNLIGDYAVFGYPTTEEGRTLTQRTDAVGSRLANELGLYDMSGNVWEWTWDWYGTYPTGAVTDFQGAASGVFRVIRGGGWYHAASNCTTAYRINSDPHGRINYFGFRVVRP